MRLARPVATPQSAAMTGALTALGGLLLGPIADGKGPFSTVALMLGVLWVGVPAYFFVLGLRKDQLVGAWMFQPALLKRIAAWSLGVISVGTVAQIALLLFGWAGIL